MKQINHEKWNGKWQKQWSESQKSTDPNEGILEWSKELQLE